MQQVLLAAGLAAGFSSSVALAQQAPAPAIMPQADSAYTDLDLALCMIMRTDDFGTVWACPGYRGYPVMVAEGDLRFMVSYGLRPGQEKAASQTLPPFNRLGPRIEWRLKREGGRFVPVATIVRFMLDAEAPASGGEVLVVTRLGEGTTCQAAWIDARANPDANELARATADRAQAFDCADDPEIVGEWRVWEP